MTRAWLAAIALLLVALIWSRIQYLGLERDFEKARAEHAIELKGISDTALAAQMSATKARDDKVREVADLDAKHHQQLTEKTHEIESRMAAVDAGRKRLWIAARCSTGSDQVPGATNAAGLDHAGAAELDPAARPTYRAVLIAAEKITAQLKGCQGYAQVITRREATTSAGALVAP